MLNNTYTNINLNQNQTLINVSVYPNTNRVEGELTPNDLFNLFSNQTELYGLSYGVNNVMNLYDKIDYFNWFCTTQLSVLTSLTNFNFNGNNTLMNV